MEPKNPWISFLPAWVLVNILGWAAYTVVLVLPIFRSAGAVCIGFLLGVLQWMVLNRYIEIDSLWAWASTLPYGLLLFIVTWLGSRLPFPFLIFCAALILGLFGFAQWSILMNYVNFALVWMAASPVAFVIGALIAWEIDRILFNPGEGSPVLFWAILGLIYGCITGVTLIFLETKLDHDPVF
jgi:hypothetical protein